jgi:hypothetical protein
MDTAFTQQINSGARGQQRNSQWTSYKHSDVMLPRNVCGGWLARMGGGRGWETAASIGLQGKFYVLEGV